MKRKQAAAAVTAVMLLSGLPCNGLSVSAEAYPPDWQPPDWVPTNFNDALKFENQYGSIHCEDGMICFVSRESTYSNAYYYTTELSGSIMEWECVNSWEETYSFVMPQPPTTDDIESWEAFYQLCNEIGLPRIMAESGNTYDPHFLYRVTLCETIPDTTMDITWNYMREGRDTPLLTQTFSFEIDADRNITETDLFAWLPDSITEFEAFTAANETVSVHEGYLVYADDVAYDGGYDVTVTQGGSARLEEILDYDVSKTAIMPPAGGQGHNVRVYKVLTPGNLKISFSQERSWEEKGESVSSDVEYYKVGKDGTFTEIDPFEPSTLPGDCNGDGFLDLADVIMLMRYLTGTGTLTVPELAEMNGDGVINAADLTRVKMYLLETNIDRDVPLPNTLTTPWQWKAIDAAYNTEFTAVFRDLIPRDDAAELFRVVLCNADTGETITEMAHTNMNTWSCTAALDVTEECTMQFYAELFGPDDWVLRTDTVSIEFSEVPPPA